MQTLGGVSDCSVDSLSRSRGFDPLSEMLYCCDLVEKSQDEEKLSLSFAAESKTCSNIKYKLTYKFLGKSKPTYNSSSHSTVTLFNSFNKTTSDTM